MDKLEISAGRIVTARIHPAIGVARVGNSADGYVIGPETPDPKPLPSACYRDGSGALKRQAARFWVYGYDAAGQVVAELTPDVAEVSWTVRLANLKASWYGFQIALDIPEARDAKPSKRRNSWLEGRERRALEIRPSPRTIGGQLVSGPLHAFEDGTFLGKAVYLGELRTDEEGRLVVLGGRGVAAGSDGAPLDDFANNDRWHDDVSDGPVTASVTIDGVAIPVEPAWVVVAPPNYAPQLKTLRTLYDALLEVFIDAGRFETPRAVSFQSDILPILQRLSGLQWVNAGFATAFGRGGWLDMQDPVLLRRLADADLVAGKPNRSGPAAALRHQVANMFRDYDRDGWSPAQLPWFYGDGMDLPPVKSPRQNSRLAKQQLRQLALWANGEFAQDYDPSAPAAASLEDLPLAERPAALDRAALDFCLADAFHPGCEVTWPVRHASMFMAPFRIRHRRPGSPPPPTGNVLSPEAALAFDGPLYGQEEGWLTRWMAVPWHTDTASCLSGYEAEYDPYLPTFWPAHVPNQVLGPAELAVLADPASTAEARLEAFHTRRDWLVAGLGDVDGAEQRRRMIQVFPNLGVVGLVESGPPAPAIPAVVLASDRPAAAAVQADDPRVPAARTPQSSGGRFGRYPGGLSRR